MIATLQRTAAARVLIGWLPLAALLTACGPGEPRTDEYRAAKVAPRASREPCLDRNPLKNAYFGDLHVHTGLSVDAYQYGVRVRPDGAYRYAFGEPVQLPPNDASGKGTRSVRIDRPLDFAGVTDHAEFLGELALCIDPDSGVYQADFCETLRTGNVRSPSLAAHIMTPIPWRDSEVCGDDYERCTQAEAPAWKEIIDAAEAWNDTSERCERTTFIAYEWSSVRLGSNLHRNIIFRNRSVLQRPISFNETPRVWDLWRQLEDLCIDAGTGCDVLAIPHNSNISNGRMFAVDYPGAWGEDAQRERAALRQRMEPIFEIMQHKGDSECRPTIPGVASAPDELCAFEKMEELTLRRGDPTGDLPGECYGGFMEDSIPHLGPDCLDRLSYARYALTEGLKEEARLGVNPFRYGLMASTDTHNGTPGAVEEKSFPGHLGKADASMEVRTSEAGGTLGNAANGPGGLIGVWSEENTRDAIFDAMSRREVFGTSGPRIEPRFFGGWGYPEDLCGSSRWLERAASGGVPMGGMLPIPEGGAEGAPDFVVSALRDPGTATAPGNLLQRIQIIKGWVDDDGVSHERVFDVAGSDNGASVDLETCEPQGPGSDRLCSVWSDPEFDAGRRAVYYARVVENPSCRHTQWACIRLPESERPASCTPRLMSRTQQERAWTSPIWYTPSEG